MATGLHQVRRGLLFTWARGRSHVQTRSLFSGSKQRRQQQELFPQRLVLPDHGYVPTLSPPQVTSLLTVNEAAQHSKVCGHHPVSGFETNMLASNFPIEDRRAVGRLVQSGGTLWGIYDGHAGAACAQAVTERLMDYVAISLLPQEVLEAYSHAMNTAKYLKC